MKKHLFFFLPLISFLSNAQEGKPQLKLEDFYQLVGEFHPIAQQAVLVRSRGDAALREARGMFDPKLVSTYNKKQFEDKNYYDVWDSYLKVPTFLNVDLKAGFERNSGIFLNPERSVPSDGLYYAGVSVPVGQGLFANARTIELKKGKLTQQELQVTGDMILNNLFLDANHVFWHWYESYQKLQVVRSNLTLINQRFNGVREAVINGENAAIDSVETLIQVQQWTNFLNKAEVDFQNSILLLENFVWNEDIALTNLNPGVSDEIENEDLPTYQDFARVNHPALRNLSLQEAKLDLDKRWSREQLKPVINLNYNLLLSEGNQLENTSFLANNYKAGVNFSFPLLLRKERGKLMAINLKYEENNLKLTQKSREVVNKVEQAYNKVLRLQEMIREQERMNLNYQRMLDGEQTKFNNGESSIFLINSRENKKLDAKMKLIELKAELGRSIGLLKWSAGSLSDEFLGLNN